MSLLVTTPEEMRQQGISCLDFILVSGDAYVDHPAFAAALLGRFLQAHGYRVGLIAQPRWQSPDDFLALGAPRLAFGVSAGNLDSMLANTTADKKRRRSDAYSPGGTPGLRPDRATLVYCNRLRELFPAVPLIIGGIEASLRRLAHYDYWEDRVRRSILLDSRAHLLVYGMGEYPLLEVLRRLDAGQDIRAITSLRGTAYVTAEPPEEGEWVTLPPYEEVASSPEAFNRATRTAYLESNPYCGRGLLQRHCDRWVVINPPPLPLTTEQLDAVYDQPFTRQPHPRYRQAGGVPALETVRHSLTSHRGCFGGCHFCSLALHQGKFIQSRSPASLRREAQAVCALPGFAGTITDVGGPSANMYRLGGRQPERCRSCRRVSCLFPDVCAWLDTDHRPSVQLLRALRQLPGIRRVFVASGVRFDLVLADRSSAYLEELCAHHVGGQLKIAPEHVVDHVTAAMGKPGRACYERFIRAFAETNRRLGRRQYLVPYFMASHPGCRLQDMLELALWVRDHLGHFPEQVQDFTPTPMTVSTAMYHTGLHPFNGRPLAVARTPQERAAQRALLQYRDPRARATVERALHLLGRTDLIGEGRHCLLRPLPPRGPASKKPPPSGGG
ncbi:MAG: YgiQ family radical SAM protein [Syntrophomonadaceae bacterium]|nr:YgiQ family radical SAM protein [Syntrophomonadaceae bacterium]